MFIHERQEKIASLVNSNGSVLVRELSRDFNVTEDCIRKDLATLEKRGLLKRVYGGAVSVRANLREYDVAQRRNENIEEKRRIAGKALQLIKDGEILFLDISTSNAELARLLQQQDRRVTVVTNMVDVMAALSMPCHVEVIFIGGSFTRGRDGFIGSASIEQIARMRYDQAFLGAVGVDPVGNSVYTYVPDDGYTKRAILKASRTSYLLVEKRKFQTEGDFQYATLEDFHGVITDTQPSDLLLERMRQYRLAVW